MALTPERRIILVTLRYARGWRLPGGGRKRDEAPEVAVLRELREEIGLVSHGLVRRGGHFGDSSLFVFQDVSYRPRWSMEIKAICEFEIGNLPPDTARITRRLIKAARVNPDA